MSETLTGEQASLVRLAARRVWRDLEFSRIFWVEFAATASFGATTALLAALHAPTVLGLQALMAAALAYALLLAIKVALLLSLEKRGGNAREFMAAELVTTGVYALSRNPVYVVSLAQSLAWSLGLLGLGTASLPSGVLACLAAPALLYGHYWGIDRLIVPNEEAALRAKHPKVFESYCARVNRWL